MRAAAFRLLLAARSPHVSAAAVVASRRLALAVFVVVLAPAEASGVFTDRAGLKAAVDAWVADAEAAEATYGAIAGWDVSRVDDMSEVFMSKTTFNSQLNWDTSRVKTMYRTFRSAAAFNSELVWDTSQVTSMRGTFSSADAFNKPLAWDTGKVKNMYHVRRANAFNSELYWDTSQVTVLHEPSTSRSSGTRAR